MIALALGCESPSEPDSSPPRVTLLSPADGSTVVDTVCVDIQASDDRGVRSVTLLADGISVGIRTRPPWEMQWDTEDLADSSFHSLQAEAQDEAGNLGRSARVRVCVRQNDPPRVRILWPPEGLWLDLDAEPRPWRCSAEDPDEGPLPPERISWRLDGIPLALQGCTVSPPALAPGTHQIAACATDAWGRTAAAGCTIHAFHYPPAATPGETLEAFQLALRARDPQRAFDCLAADFVFLPPTADAASQRWAQEHEALAVRSLLEHPGLGSLEVAMTLGSIEQFLWDQQTFAKIEIRDLWVRVQIMCGDSPDAAASSSTWEVTASAARIFLRATRGDAQGGAWELLGWWDLHATRGCDCAGRSWHELKAAALADRLCP